MVMSVATGKQQWLELGGGALRDVLGRSPLKVLHRLDGDPLLNVTALATIADSWPLRWLEHHLADDLPLLLPTGEAEQLDVAPGDVVRGIDSNRSWVALWFLEHVDAYHSLLDECLDQVAGVIGSRDGRMGRRGV